LNKTVLPATAPPPARDRRDPQTTRQALLRAGADLFSEHGFDGVATEALAARAGVNKALISYHFGGKRGLYQAVLSSAFGAIAERLQRIEDESLRQGRGAREILHLLLQAFDALRRERPDFPTLFVREVLSTGIEPTVAPHLVEILGVVSRLAERGAREGVFRRVDPLSLHFGLVGALVFFLATEPARRRAVAERRLPFRMPDFPSFLRYIEELTLRGLSPSGRRVHRAAPGRLALAPRRKGARA
jgi:AcrR family transcriptional regulator